MPGAVPAADAAAMEDEVWAFLDHRGVVRDRPFTGPAGAVTGLRAVVELTGRAGDAFVMHCDTLHAVSANTQDGPRMMSTAIVLTTGR